MALIDEEPNPIWATIDGVLAFILCILVASKTNQPPPDDAGLFHAFMDLYGWVVVAFFAWAIGHLYTRIGFVFAVIATAICCWIW